ncbi:leukocyte common antigen, partial [Plakobranchus ocellatus]
CPIGTYGKDCAYECSTNCTKQTCDRNTGRCLLCPPGSLGYYCERVGIVEGAKGPEDPNMSVIVGAATTRAQALRETGV